MAKDLATAPRIGMGCWAIGGPFWNGDEPVGYSGSTDANSLMAIEASLEAGVTVFDTSAVYGAGHSETLLGQALAHRPEAIIVSKLGHSFDAATKQMTGPRTDPAYIRASIENSRQRLRRDRIDVMLLHLNDLALAEAEPVFDTLAEEQARGRIGSYGWSTDFWTNLDRIAHRPGFSTVQHAMNVFIDAPAITEVADRHGLTQMIRSPLAMGLLAGSFDNARTVGADDVRSKNDDLQRYFIDGRASPASLDKLNAVRELLKTGGRTLGQGALCWLLAKSPRILPIPGAKTARQATENAAALSFGPLPAPIMEQIEQILPQARQTEPQEL